MIRFIDLNDKAKKVAIKEYMYGWRKTHPDDPLTVEDVTNILTFDLREEAYNINGSVKHE